MSWCLLAICQNFRILRIMMNLNEPGNEYLKDFVEFIEHKILYNDDMYKWTFGNDVLNSTPTEEDYNLKERVQ